MPKGHEERVGNPLNPECSLCGGKRDMVDVLLLCARCDKPVIVQMLQGEMEE